MNNIGIIEDYTKKAAYSAIFHIENILNLVKKENIISDLAYKAYMDFANELVETNYPREELADLEFLFLDEDSYRHEIHKIFEKNVNKILEIFFDEFEANTGMSYEIVIFEDGGFKIILNKNVEEE